MQVLSSMYACMQLADISPGISTCDAIFTNSETALVEPLP